LIGEEIMAKIDEVKARIDWLKEMFKILITVMVADVAGLAKLYLDNTISILFYLGASLLFVLVISCVVISQKIERQIKELGNL
jgi:hypothetical protein